jgi:glycolate oxidase subunit GlcD
MVDKAEIFDKLKSIVGEENASMDEAVLRVYSYDVSPYKGRPDFVVRPGTPEEIAEIVKLANQYKIPVIPRGAGSGAAGGAVPVNGGIVIELTRLNRILEIDTANLQVVVEPGVVHATLNKELAKLGYFFPVDPGSTDMATIGGLISNGGSGMRSVKYGVTRDYVMQLEIVLPSGEIVTVGSKAPKSASGYDLPRLFVGAEGTLGIITKARLKILPMPQAKALVLAAFDDLEKAGNAVVNTFAAGIVPSGLEILDRSALEAVKTYRPNLDIPIVEALLLFEVDGTPAGIREEAARIEEVCKNTGAVKVDIATSKERFDELWAARAVVGAATTALNPDCTRVYEAEDITVPITNVPKILLKIREIGKKYGMNIVTFGHIGSGNLHPALVINVLDDDEWDKLWKVSEEIQTAALEMGGTTTGEHGIGIARARFMEAEHGKAMELMRVIKKALDPNNIMNPGKMAL